MHFRAFFRNLVAIGFMTSYSIHVIAQESSQMQEALQAAQNEPWAVEVYYEIRDGYEQEFLELYRKNHWPVLNGEIEDGSLISVEVHMQMFAQPGPHQWDFRVTQVFTNMLYHHGLLDRKQDEIISRLYPDRELFDEEESYREGLIEYATILEGTRISTDEWPTSNTQ
ncbi:MAG: hypothetical protein P8J61_11020 [Gammaproteobacteria bacterium]|jgi:hypothetical protein|nr:hypothetical protein [Gammaproteobacteria bacterium]